MNEMMEQSKTLNGLDVHVIPTEKFKTITAVLKFRTALNEKTVTSRALLAYVLKSATAKSPTTQELERRLDDLYGASLSAGLSKKGNNHLLTLMVTAASEQFLSTDISLLDQSLNLLAEVVFQPLVNQGAFDAATVNKEKRSLKQHILSVYDDKMRYANQRLIDEMCKQEVFRLHTYGYAEELDKITPESLFAVYQKMIAEDKIDLYVVGQIDPDEVFSRSEAAFNFNRRLIPEQTDTGSNPSSDEVQVIEEKQAVNQGKLNLGFRTNIISGDRLYPACQVFNGLFGVFPHSKLFINVREKASLAYYASSSYESYKGLLVVASGIETANFDKAVAIIKEQLSEMQKGHFSDSDIEQTKAMINNGRLEVLDSPYAMIESLYQDVLSGKATPFEDKLKQIQQVTREEVIEAAKRIKLDTIFFLKGEPA